MSDDPKKKLLIIGDFAAATGFANVCEPLAAELLERGWDIAVLAVQYQGDPHPLQRRYRLYPALTGGDLLGLARVAAVARVERPDVILIVNDPPVVCDYLEALGQDAPPVVAYMPVDAPGMNPSLLEGLNQLGHAIAYTAFGARELQAAGYTGPLSIVPHGVDVELFQPGDQAAARARAGLDPDCFAVLVVDRNQPRKRLDIAFAAFARFAREVPTARLIYHGALNDVGWDLPDLARQHGISDQFTVTARHMSALRGLPRAQLPTIYQLADVKLSTAMGEGWGLTTMEAMACGAPCIALDCAAIGEWAAGAAYLVRPDEELTHTYAGGLNTRGAIARVGDVAEALFLLHDDAAMRADLGRRGRALVSEDRFRWPTITSQFDQVLRQVAEGVAV